jgi:uncharacterized membrane protein (DUF106 family)
MPFDRDGGQFVPPPVDKNRPIVVVASICAAIVSVAILVSCRLFIDLHRMNCELTNEMDQFKVYIFYLIDIE